ncbi:MAG: ABC transporter permease [Proteobacteria bacterium]|nr:ABC transporter permease [Pseudomonadota bacterium]
MQWAWLARRLVGAVPTILLTWTIVFSVLQFIPGDPVILMLQGNPASEEVMTNERHRLGLDRPIIAQYASFMWNVARGDLGRSFRTRQPVTAMILEQMPHSLELALGGLLIGILLGTAMGVFAGMRPSGWADTGAMTVALIGLSLPSFWIGMLLIHVFGIMLGWVPILGRGFDALILPSITVGLFLAGGLARLVRSSIIEVMGQDYVRTARAKGLPMVKIIGKHVLRNAMIPPITLLGIQFAVLIGGAVVTERVFARPGLGTMLIESVLTKDIPLVQALVVYTTTVYILINLAIDLLYGLIDPRIRPEPSR